MEVKAAKSGVQWREAAEDGGLVLQVAVILENKNWHFAFKTLLNIHYKKQYVTCAMCSRNMRQKRLYRLLNLFRLLSPLINRVFFFFIFIPAIRCRFQTVTIGSSSIFIAVMFPGYCLAERCKTKNSLGNV